MFLVNFLHDHETILYAKTSLKSEIGYRKVFNKKYFIIRQLFEEEKTENLKY